MPAFKTDQALWYNNGVWGELGYAVPNCGDNTATLNHGIAYLVDSIGRNLSAVMHHGDADLRTPPTLNTLTRIHKLIVRGRTILASRMVPANELTMESTHASPAKEDFIVYPVPFFRVRNQWLREYCGYILSALSEAVQHTENRKPYDFSKDFAGIIGQYLHRVYKLMATELFMIPDVDASKLDFTLTDAQLASYDPAKFFTQTEMIDVAPPVTDVPTEDDLVVLTNGIPASKLVGLQQWPSGGSADTTTGESSGGGTGGSAVNTTAFAPSPGV